MTEECQVVVRGKLWQVMTPTRNFEAIDGSKTGHKGRYSVILVVGPCTPELSSLVIICWGWRICVLLTVYLTDPEASCRCDSSHLCFFRRQGGRHHSSFTFPPNCRKSAYSRPQRRVRIAQLRRRSQWRETAQAGQQMTCRLCTQLC